MWPGPAAVLAPGEAGLPSIRVAPGQLSPVFVLKSRFEGLLSDGTQRRLKGTEF